jgi:hypothetical protein
MLLREWLLEIGARSTERTTLSDIKGFVFTEDAYFVEMHDGRTFQDNDLSRILSLIRDEFRTNNTTSTLRGFGQPMHPAIEFPFQKGKQQMFVRPVVWTNVIPPPELDLVIEMLERNVTFFNLTGSFQPTMKKDNL